MIGPSALMGRRILVTGGLGFVGNEVTRQLQAADVAVAILDIGHRRAPRIEDLSSVPRYEVDLTDGAAVRAAVADYAPDAIIHLAAIHFVPECNAEPGRTLRVNVEGTQHLADAAVSAGVTHLVFASSGAVYADAVDPLREDTPITPVDVYGVSKYAGELALGLFANRGRIRVTIVRLFNVYGPRETNAHIIPEIVAQLRCGDVLRLGNVTTVRDYVHVRDAADGFIRFATSHGPSFRVANLGTGTGYSVKDLVARMGALLGRPISIETDHTRYREADKQVQVASTVGLQAALGWIPETPLDAGLRDLLRFEKLLT